MKDKDSIHLTLNFILFLDAMSDKEYISAVMNMSEEQKTDVMKNEARRLKTYYHLWPNPTFMDFTELAREGFYYTGNRFRSFSRVSK